jgi:hypothetical protein
VDPEPHRKRIVAISDLHCGHEFGLTPPAWQYKSDGHPRISKAAAFQRALWDFAVDALENLKPIDTLVVNGDAIDGKGDKSGGIEQITTDRLEQGEMAAEFINLAEAKQVRLLYGTRYHVGRDEDFEQTLVDKINAKDVNIQGHGFFDVNGCVLDVKHKVGGSSIPHGRHTAISRAHLWNLLWAEHGRQPKANIILRGHNHYFCYAGGADWLAVNLPALSYGTSYGIRECDGIVDVGMVAIDIDRVGGWKWQPVLAEFKQLKAAVECL